ncbi:MAG TPA: hypothetical protein VND89_01400 [Acidimicrobiales bacterium]|nr:hypothetical protein [Acidimicrobiales bacterium]
MSRWGNNANGQLGNDSTISSATPVAVDGIKDATQLSVGTSYACAVLSSGTVSCWGANSSGQLGNGSTTASLKAAAVSNIDNATSVETSVNHTCASRFGDRPMLGFWCLGRAR